MFLSNGPVSYTHLFLTIFLLNREAAFPKFFGRQIFVNRIKNSLKPVSYTHLDVYKRQALRWHEIDKFHDRNR